MKQQDDLQRLIDATRKYCKEHGIREQDEVEAIKALYNLIPRQAEMPKSKAKKRKKEETKDFYDMWIDVIKNRWGGM